MSSTSFIDENESEIDPLGEDGQVSSAHSRRRTELVYN